MSIRDWNGDKAIETLHVETMDAIERACIIVWRRADRLLSIEGTGREGTVKDRSRPGEPPRKQTGELKDSVTYEIDEKLSQGRVGTNVDHGKYLELGTKRGILPRPWLRRALLESADEINNALGRKK
jgi:hypothetical protein